MAYIGIIIYILPFLAILIGTIFAFLAQKNWATITMLISTLLILLSLGLSIYATTILMEEFMAEDTYTSSSYYDNLMTLVQVLAISSPFIFVTGLIGFMYTSSSIYNKADALQHENNKLAHKLNQL